MPPRPRYPRDKDELLREVDVRIRLHDIRKLYATKDRLNPKWWETVVLLILFASAFGLLASMIQYARVNDEVLNWWMLFWFSLMVLSVVASFEFLLVKIFALRRVNELLVRLVEDLRLKQGDIVRKVDEVIAVVNEINDEERSTAAQAEALRPIAHFDSVDEALEFAEDSPPSEEGSSAREDDPRASKSGGPPPPDADR